MHVSLQRVCHVAAVVPQVPLWLSLLIMQPGCSKANAGCSRSAFSLGQAAAGWRPLLVGAQGRRVKRMRGRWRSACRRAAAAGHAQAVPQHSEPAAAGPRWPRMCCSRFAASATLTAAWRAAHSPGMKAIDLACQMLAPVAAGFLMTYAGMWLAVLVIAGYSVIVWLPECLLLQRAYSQSPLLRWADCAVDGRSTSARVLCCG
jgi:Ferroportin1 (FPN1)